MYVLILVSLNGTELLLEGELQHELGGKMEPVVLCLGEMDHQSNDILFEW